MPDEVYLRGMDLLRRYKRKLSPDEGKDRGLVRPIL